jgi:hypothetical protein
VGVLTFALISSAEQSSLTHAIVASCSFLFRFRLRFLFRFVNGGRSRPFEHGNHR